MTNFSLSRLWYPNSFIPQLFFVPRNQGLDLFGNFRYLKSKSQAYKLVFLRKFAQKFFLIHSFPILHNFLVIVPFAPISISHQIFSSSFLTLLALIFSIPYFFLFFFYIPKKFYIPKIYFNPTLSKLSLKHWHKQLALPFLNSILFKYFFHYFCLILTIRQWKIGWLLNKSNQTQRIFHAATLLNR